MGQKDLAEKLLEDYNDVFADIINALLFDGKIVVLPEELHDTKINSSFLFVSKFPILFVATRTVLY